MFIIGNLLQGLALLIRQVIPIYELILIVRIILTWVPVDQFHPLVQFLFKITDPFLNIFRKFIPPIGMIDISPIVGFLCLRFIGNFVVQTLWDISVRLQ